MNLGELKAIVDTWTDEDFVFKCQSFHTPHSYRGWHILLAFEYCDSPLTVAAIKQSVCRAYMEVFTGQKVVEYVYDDLTPVHLSRQAYPDNKEGHRFTELVFAMDREYRNFYSEVCYNTPMQTNTETKMATKRKTAAEKRAEAEALRSNEHQLEDARNLALARFLATYQTRLLTLVHSYVSELYHAMEAVGSSEYKAFEFKTSRYCDVRLPFDMEHDTRTVTQLREDMEEAERFLETTREAERKERERLEKKSVALAKLTEEERELLGL
jgi:hypothetical protein